MINELSLAIGLEMALILNGYSLDNFNRLISGSTVNYETTINNN